MKAKRPYLKKRKRLGRGPGTGHGKTSGKGHKGQLARSGPGLRAGFEGGQNPLYRRLPKRGFNNAAFAETYSIVNLSRLATLDVTEVTPELLKERGVIKEIYDGLKVLGDGELKKAMKISAHKFSVTAKQKIEKAGGQAVTIN